MAPLIRTLSGGKILYLAVVLCAVGLWNRLDVVQFYAVDVRWPRTGEPVLASHFATFDSAPYLLLSEKGYVKGNDSCAFYPLWPLVMRAAAPLFGGNHLIAGLALSNLFSVAAWVLFYRLVARRWGAQAALWALVFLIAFPGSLFFQFIYTESLFLFLLMGLWWALEEQRYGWAAVCAGLLPICRGIGAFVVLPLAWYALSVAPPQWFTRVWSSPWTGPGGRVPSRGDGDEGAADRACWVGLPVRANRALTGEPGLPRWAPWLLAGMPVVGFGVYLALMGHWTGNPFEGFVAQQGLGVHSIPNLWNLPKFAIGFFNPTQWHSFTGSLLDRSMFVLLLYTLPVLWRLDKGLLVWAYVLGILPAMSGTFTSFTRFASCVFPLFIALGVVLSRREWRGLRYGLLVVFVALHVVLLWRHVNFRWAG